MRRSLLAITAVGLIAAGGLAACSDNNSGDSGSKKYSGKDVVVYFVMTDSLLPKSRNYASNEDVRKFSATNKLGMTILRDPDGSATLKKFGVDEIPSFVILDKSGNKSGENFGGIDPKFDITVPISKAVDKLL